MHGDAGRLRPWRDPVSWRLDLNLAAVLLVGLLVGLAYAHGGFAKPVDAIAYWEAGSSTHLYPEHWSEVATGYLFYPPPVAQLSTLLQPLGWQLFVVALMLTTFGAFWYCARGLSLPLLLMGIPYFVGIGPSEPATFLSYALLGNLQWILAALVVVAMRHPAAYPALIMTKITTGIGWLWPLFRGEWRMALVGAATCVAFFAVSFAADPGLWFEFIGFATRNASMAAPPMPMFPLPFAVRLPMSIAILAWGAATNRRWTVPVAAGWALPALYGWGFLPFWIAAVRLADPPRVEIGRWLSLASARARYGMGRPDAVPVLVENVASD